MTSFDKVSAREVNAFHEHDDVDSAGRAHHHTLGEGVNQAARGSELKTTNAVVSVISDKVDALEITTADHETRLDVLEARPSGEVTAGSATNLAVSGNNYVIAWDAVSAALVGTGLTLDLANEKIVVTKAGRYRIETAVAFAANATGYRRARILLNGTPIKATAHDANTVAALATVVQVASIRTLAVNDEITVDALQTSGGALLTAVGTYQSTLSVEMI